MSWLDVWLGRGGRLIKKVGVGFSWRGDFLTAKHDKCQKCRVERKKHQSMTHPFTEVAP